MTSVYVTVLDSGYLVRGVCLYRSLMRHPAKKHFIFYCVDQESADVLEALSLPQSEVVRALQYETSELLKIRRERSRSAYCWTLKPVIVEHALAHINDASWVIYLDSDMMAFGDPDAALDVPSTVDVLLTPHHFSLPSLAVQQPIVGRFNAGYVAFRASDRARAALRWWRDRCIELCPSVPTRGIYADQTYLDDFDKLFPGAVAEAPRGLNVAPWNMIGAKVDVNGTNLNIDGAEILTFHFQSLRILSEHYFELYAGEFEVPPDIVKFVYRPYLQGLTEAFRVLRTAKPDFAQGIERWQHHPMRILRLTRRILFGPNNLVSA